MVISMDDSWKSPVLAIDGGGTRCRLAVADGHMIVSIETGSANVSTDFDAAVREVMQGLVRLAERLERPMGALYALPAFVGLAGVTGPAMAERLRTALPLKHVRIADDRPAALRGALGGKDGVIAHCGTGSFFAAQINGASRFAGGWGPVLGDEASAQWIGRAALRMTLESSDGRCDPSPLCKHLLSDFGDTAGIVRFAGAALPSQFGALAPLVTEFARRGDNLACDIMRSGAGEIVRTLPKMGWIPGLSICLTGGIGPHYVPYLPQDMQASIMAPAGEPLDGAISLARDLAKDLAQEIAYERH